MKNVMMVIVFNLMDVINVFQNAKIVLFVKEVNVNNVWMVIIMMIKIYVYQQYVVME